MDKWLHLFLCGLKLLIHSQTSMLQPLKFGNVYIWNKVNIWNVNCVRATAFIFDTQTDVLEQVSKFLRQKLSLPEGDSNPPTFEFMPNSLTIWAIRARHLLSHVFNTGSGGINIFEVKLPFEFHPTLYWACDYLSMLGLKLKHISKGATASKVSMPLCWRLINSAIWNKLRCMNLNQPKHKIFKGYPLK